VKKPRAALALFAAASALWAAGATAADAPAAAVGAPATIGAPHYGDTLFLFYQDKTFEALTGLMVSQHFGRIAPHGDEAEVLRGGLLLSYGLHDEAAAVFARLIENNAPPAVQDRAWFFLAQVRHQRGLLALAEEALGRIKAALPPALEDERQLMHAQLLMSRNDFSGAAAMLDTLQASPTAGLYARFNLGVALVRAGDVARGHALLDALGQVSAPNEELRSLRDRANVALGFASLAIKKPREARMALQRVRLNSPSSNKALLGFGWAATELNDPKLALVPWTELAGRGSAGGADASVLEARIAVPYALAELGAFSGALLAYEEATAGFEREHVALNESMAAIRAGKLVQGLMNQNPGAPGLDGFKGINALPEMPHATHLAPLLAGNEFQEGFKNLRDLQFLQGNLAQWLDKLGAYNDMLDNRRRAFADKLPTAQAGASATDIAALQARRDALAAELARVRDEADTAAYATPRERDALQRLAHGRRTLVDAGEQADLAEAAERVRRAAGALTWQLAQEFNAREWEARKGLRATDTALAQASQRNAALARAQQEEPTRQARLAERTALLAQRIAALQPVLLAAQADQAEALQDIAVAELRAQQDRLGVYAAQARLAIAQIHDRAQFARRTDTEAPQ
jgi:hypothetical protein